jgi:3-dehydroquinate synthase class II
MMKKIVGILLFVIICTNLNARPGRLDFVATNNGIFYFKNVRHGFSTYLIGVQISGELTKFSKKEIVVYTKNGKQFEKMPLFDETGSYVDDVFMQLINTENGLKVYKYVSIKDKENEQFKFLVYSNKKYLGIAKNSNSLSKFY